MSSFLQTKKQRLIAIFIGAGTVILIFLAWIIWDFFDTRRVDAEALTLQPNLSVEFDTPAQASDFIARLNGELLADPKIDTNTLGAQTITIEYKNLKHRKRTREITVEVVDSTKPIIYGGSEYTVPINYAGDLTNLMLSGDDIDDHPTREIIGEYDLAQLGDYPLEYRITDQSDNVTSKKFTLHVVQPVTSDPTYQPSPKTPISSIIKQHKTAQTKIGIDVSSWQGEIDWVKVKNSGVDFAIIRAGYQIEFGGELIVDKYFQTNLKNASAAGLPIGVYFYSCATNPTEAQQQVNWIIEQISDYWLELGLAFDWEEWHNFNDAKMSFRTLNQTAKAFLDTAVDAGYPAMLYGSKTYLENFWTIQDYPIWLAQYYDFPTYTGDFRIWQLSNTGQVPGIYGDVDLNILYLEEE